jgi:hypothetical protein
MKSSITKRFIKDITVSSQKYQIDPEALARIVLQLTTKNKKVMELITISTRKRLEEYQEKISCSSSPVQTRLLTTSCERMCYDSSIICCNSYLNMMLDKLGRYIHFIYSNPLLTKKTHERLSSFRTIPKYRLII